MVPWEPHPQHTDLRQGGTLQSLCADSPPRDTAKSSGLKSTQIIQEGSPFTNTRASAEWEVNCRRNSGAGQWKVQVIH